MSPNRRITISDIAQKAGVSKQTVSRVINDKSDVSPATREKVKSIINALGYSPDPIARSMKGKTNTLGILADDFSKESTAKIVNSAQIEANKNGFSVLVDNLFLNSNTPPSLIKTITRRVDGLLIIHSHNNSQFNYISQKYDPNIPIVFVNGPFDNSSNHTVGLDNFIGGLTATNYLLSLGHTAIVTILGSLQDKQTQERYSGYKKAFEVSGLEEDQRLVLQGNWTFESGEIALNRLLGYGTFFSAIFAINDLMALGAIKALRDANINVPEEVSVVGFDNQLFSAYMSPPLTTVKQPYDIFGETGINLLIETINTPSMPPKNIKYAPKLIIRESCKLYPK